MRPFALQSPVITSAACPEAATVTCTGLGLCWFGIKGGRHSRPPASGAYDPGVWQIHVPPSIALFVSPARGPPAAERQSMSSVARWVSSS